MIFDLLPQNEPYHEPTRADILISFWSEIFQLLSDGDQTYDSLTVVLDILRLGTRVQYYLPTAVTDWGKAIALKHSLC